MKFVIGDVVEIKTSEMYGMIGRVTKVESSKRIFVRILMEGVNEDTVFNSKDLEIYEKEKILEEELENIEKEDKLENIEKEKELEEELEEELEKELEEEKDSVNTLEKELEKELEEELEDQKQEDDIFRPSEVKINESIPISRFDNISSMLNDIKKTPENKLNNFDLSNSQVLKCLGLMA